MRSLLAILVFLSFGLYCQETRTNVFSLKPSFGINACQVHGDTYDGYHKLGFFVGVAVNASLGQKTSLELGFYFSQKGSRHTPSKDDPKFYRLNLNYIDLPLSLRYAVNSKYFITLGPSIAYLINHQEDENYVDRSSAYKYNSTEIGINFGLGRKIKEKFFIEVRSSNSLTAIRSIPNNYIYYNNPIARFFNKGYYNNILSIFLTYKIELKKNREQQ
jgi:hypothetical protein